LGLTFSEAALIAANLVPVVGVLWLGWDVGTMMVLYWTENLVVAFYAFLKLRSIDLAERGTIARPAAVLRGGECETAEG
jgi:hypothetical protein